MFKKNNHLPQKRMVGAQKSYLLFRGEEGGFSWPGINPVKPPTRFTVQDGAGYPKPMVQ